VVTNPNYVKPTEGYWSGDEMYRLVRMLVGLQIQAVTKELMNSFFPQSGFNDPESYPYTINPNVRLNKGLTLESALLFNFPTFQPEAFHVRNLRMNQTACVESVTPNGNNVDYLDTFPADMERYIQGSSEFGIDYTSGIFNSNRGNKDIMAILIRRGREMGLPSFTQLRDAISWTPSGCAWDNWDSLECVPSTMFKASVITGLRALYKTPADVELIVGSLLSADRVPTNVDFGELNAMGIDATQVYLVLGEIDRIMRLDAFGLFKVQSGEVKNSYFVRFQNDDPLFGVPQPLPLGLTRCYADQVMTQCIFKSASQLVQLNTNVQCLPQKLFLIGGMNDDPNLFNLKQLFSPNGDLRQRINCDITQPQHDNFETNFPFGLTYTDFFCSGSEPCFNPGLPFCTW
jgi:hypothetical protein